MVSNVLLPAYDRFLDRILESMSPEQILAFEASEEEQAYAQDLIERNNAGTLTPEESVQLDQMLQFERMMSVLKAKALRALKKP